MAIKPIYITGIDENKLRLFDCGDSKYSTMSFFLHDEALALHKDGTAFTQVYIDTNNNDAIVGYTSLKASCFQYIIRSEYTDEELLHVVPAVEIARFAIATEYQGRLYAEAKQNYSEYVLFQALQDIMSLRDYAIGVKAAILFSVNRPKQLHFYSKSGFERLSEQYVFKSTENEECVPMYMPLPDSPLELYTDE